MNKTHICTLVAFLIATAAAADDPPTHTVNSEPFKIEVQLDGVFESSDTSEVTLRPEAWAELSVLSAAPHGKSVEAGDTILRLDPQKLEIAISDLETDLAAGQLALKQAEKAQALLEKTVPMSLAAARRTHSDAVQNLDRYMKIDRAQAIKDNDFSLESARNSLEYTREELRQLEKMYKADDLTEETEEIILTRARNRVKSAEFYFEKSVTAHEEALKIGLPRRDVTMKDAAAQATLKLEEAQSTLPASIAEKRIALEKLRTSHNKSKEKLARLRRDLQRLTVKAPASGIVYYGQNTRGRWAEIGSVGKLLRNGATAPANKVLMTIVDPSKLFVRTTVAEKDLHNMRRGAKITIKPTAFPERSLNGKLHTISHVPFADGKFDATIQLDGGQDTDFLMAGMNGKATVQVYHRDSAILIPRSAVTLEEDGKAGEVEVLQKDGGTKSRRVRTGRTNGDRIEILKGLKEGDKVVLPKKESTDDKKEEKTDEDEKKADKK